MKEEEGIGDARTRCKKEVTGDWGKQKKQRLRGQEAPGRRKVVKIPVEKRREAGGQRVVEAGIGE